MKYIERRIQRLETEKNVDEDFGLYVIDETLPDGTMISNGQPVVLKPGASALIISRHTRR